MKKIFVENKELLERVVELYEELKVDKKKDLKLSAIKHLMEVDRPYDNHCFEEKLLVNLYLKKLDFIKDATTKKEIGEILSVSHISNSGGKIIPTRYNIIEEELMMWSLASLRAPLSDIACKRYFDLFKEYYGKDINELVSERKSVNNK